MFLLDRLRRLLLHNTFCHSHTEEAQAGTVDRLNSYRADFYILECGIQSRPGRYSGQGLQAIAEVRGTEADGSWEVVGVSCLPPRLRELQKLQAEQAPEVPAPAPRRHQVWHRASGSQHFDVHAKAWPENSAEASTGGQKILAEAPLRPVIALSGVEIEARLPFASATTSAWAGPGQFAECGPQTCGVSWRRDHEHVDDAGSRWRA